MIFDTSAIEQTHACGTLGEVGTRVLCISIIGKRASRSLGDKALLYVR